MLALAVNFVYIDILGAGFSYSLAGETEVIDSSNDFTSSSDFFAAITLFFDVYQKLFDRNLFYLSSSGYFAGHLIPQVALLIMNHQNGKIHDRFGGVVLTNPYLSFSNEISGALSLWGRQKVAKPLWCVVIFLPSSLILF